MKPITVERWWPYVFATAATAAWYYFGARFPAEPAGLLGATGTTSAVMVGFLATMNAIVLSITGSPVFRQLRKAGFHNDLFRYVNEATTFAMLLLVVSLVGFFVIVDKEPVPTLYSTIWVGSGTLSFLLFVRVFRILSRLLTKA